MMHPDEIEDFAMVSRPLPSDTAFPEVWLYQCLRALHAAHRVGGVSREQATKEKHTLVDRYREMEFKDKVYTHNISMWPQIEKAGNAFGRERTLENADRFYAAVYGVSKNWRLKRKDKNEEDSQ